MKKSKIVGIVVVAVILVGLIVFASTFKLKDSHLRSEGVRVRIPEGALVVQDCDEENAIYCKKTLEVNGEKQTLEFEFYNFKENGAKAALIYSPLKYMMVKDYEKSVNENDDLTNFIDKMKGYDLIILEGFKHINNIPKIEVFRTSVSDKPFCDDKSIMALVTDNLSYKTDLPILNINDISSIMNFIISNIITI